MMEPMCNPCQKDGVLRKALRILPKLGPMCHDHYQKWLRESFHQPNPAPPMPTLEPSPLTLELVTRETQRVAKQMLPLVEEEVTPLEAKFERPISVKVPPREKKRMPKQLDQAKIEEIQKLAKEGRTINQIAKIAMVSFYFAQKYSGAELPAKKPPKRIVEAKPTNGSGLQYQYGAVLEELIAKRDKLNAAIEALQGL